MINVPHVIPFLLIFGRKIPEEICNKTHIYSRPNRVLYVGIITHLLIYSLQPPMPYHLQPQVSHTVGFAAMAHRELSEHDQKC